MTTTPTRNGARRAWGWLLFDGILGVIIGIVALVSPGITVLTLALLLGIGLLFQGAAQFGAGLRAASGSTGRGWTIFFGIMSIVAGLICIFHPGAGAWAIALGVTIWFFAAAINELFAAFTMSEHRVWNLFVGIVTLIAAVVMVANPGLALSTAALIAGILFLIRGIGEIGLAMRLRSL